MSLSHIFYLLLSTGLFMSLKPFVAEQFLQVINKWGGVCVWGKPLQRCNMLVFILSVVSLEDCTIKLMTEMWVFCKLKVISLHAFFFFFF